MKVRTQHQEEERKNCIYLEAETPEESMVILAMVKRTKKPNRAFGHFRENGLAWAWFNMPAKKMDTYEITKIDSEA